VKNALALGRSRGQSVDLTTGIGDKPCARSHAGADGRVVTEGSRSAALEVYEKRSDARRRAGQSNPIPETEKIYRTIRATNQYRSKAWRERGKADSPPTTRTVPPAITSPVSSDGNGSRLAGLAAGRARGRPGVVHVGRSATGLGKSALLATGLAGCGGGRVSVSWCRAWGTCSSVRFTRHDAPAAIRRATDPRLAAGRPRIDAHRSACAAGPAGVRRGRSCSGATTLHGHLCGALFPHDQENYRCCVSVSAET